MMAKSTESDPSGSVDVVEVEGGVEVRDTRRVHSPVLEFSHEEWDAFLTGVSDGQFERGRMEWGGKGPDRRNVTGV